MQTAPGLRRLLGLHRMVWLTDPVRRLIVVLQIYVLFALLVFPVPARAQSPSIVTITVDTSHAVNRFIPSHALGAGVDGHEFGETLKQLSPGNVKAMRSAGLKPLTYRLRTEL